MEELENQDLPIKYFEKEIKNAEEDKFNSIFLGCPKQSNLPLWVIFSIAFGLYFMLSIFIGNVVLLPMTVNGSSMYPTLNYEYTTTANTLAEDVVYLSKTTKYEYRDIIVFNATPYTDPASTEPVYYIKRVIGVGGDRLQFKRISEPSSYGNAEFVLYRNGELLNEDYIASTMILNTLSTSLSEFTTEKEIVVPEGFVFVMGDNRNNSRDSRELGFINLSDCVGKVTILIPYGKTLIYGIIKSIKYGYLF